MAWSDASKLTKEFRDGFHHFYNQCEGRYKKGARTPGCMPDRIRTNIPRKLKFDPEKEEMERIEKYATRKSKRHSRKSRNKD